MEMWRLFKMGSRVRLLLGAFLYLLVARWR